MTQLKGGLSDKIKQLREEIIYQIAFIESALDDPEHYSLDGFPEKLLEEDKWITIAKRCWILTIMEELSQRNPHLYRR